MAAHERPPITTRVMNWGGILRLGVFGSLSLISSPIAASVNSQRVIAELKKFRDVPSRLSQPQQAAQLIIAGAIIARSPAMTPIKNADTSTGILYLVLN